MKILCKLTALTFIVVLHNFSFASTPDTSALNKILSELIPAEEPGCSIGVYEKAIPLIKKGFGLANTELNVPLSDNNVHRMASVSKQFVAMAVHLLADQGKINLKDDIKAYVPGLPDYGERVSIESIIGHIAGMGDYDMISSFGAPDGYVAPEGALNLKAVSGHPFRIGNEDYLSVAEFFLYISIPFIVPNYYESFDYYKSLNLYEFSIAISVIGYILLLYFMLRFFRNYKRISVTDSVKGHLSTILNTRRAVNQYIYFSLGIITFKPLFVV